MDDEKALLFIREEIDSIDSELISLLESRLNLSLEIGKIKKRMKISFTDLRGYIYISTCIKTV